MPVPAWSVSLPTTNIDPVVALATNELVASANDALISADVGNEPVASANDALISAGDTKSCGFVIVIDP